MASIDNGTDKIGVQGDSRILRQSATIKNKIYGMDAMVVNHKQSIRANYPYTGYLVAQPEGSSPPTILLVRAAAAMTKQ